MKSNPKKKSDEIPKPIKSGSVDENPSPKKKSNPKKESVDEIPKHMKSVDVDENPSPKKNPIQKRKVWMKFRNP